MTNLTETLPVLHRLALSYAPARAREPTLALLAFDSRLAEIVLRASEPMLAQIRLAWWRETLAQAPSQWPRGEPLFALLEHWSDDTDALIALVDGWEHLAGVPSPDRLALESCATARGEAFGALAAMLGHHDVTNRAQVLARDWAVIDLASRLSMQGALDIAQLASGVRAGEGRRLPRDLRPLTLLNGLALRSLRKGRAYPDLSASTVLAAVRLGLFGF